MPHLIEDSSEQGLPWWLSSTNPPASAGDTGSIPDPGIPWRMKWQPTSVFLPEKLPWIGEPGHDSATKKQQSSEQACLLTGGDNQILRLRSELRENHF